MKLKLILLLATLVVSPVAGFASETLTGAELDEALGEGTSSVGIETPGGKFAIIESANVDRVTLTNRATLELSIQMQLDLGEVLNELTEVGTAALAASQEALDTEDAIAASNAILKSATSVFAIASRLLKIHQRITELQDLTFEAIEMKDGTIFDSFEVVGLYAPTVFFDNK